MTVYRKAGPFLVAEMIVSWDGKESRPANDAIKLPDGGEIILCSRFADGTLFGLRDINHNLFRLDKNGNVIWQVKRFECGKSNWRQVLRRLKREGSAAAESAARQPFMNLLRTFYRRGVFNPLHYENIPSEDKSKVPLPGFVLIANTGNEWYEVDIDTGVAINVTPRPWAAHG
jgi:hypothetical protein